MWLSCVCRKLNNHLSQTSVDEESTHSYRTLFPFAWIFNAYILQWSFTLHTTCTLSMNILSTKSHKQLALPRIFLFFVSTDLLAHSLLLFHSVMRNFIYFHLWSFFLLPSPPPPPLLLSKIHEPSHSRLFSSLLSSHSHLLILVRKLLLQLIASQQTYHVDWVYSMNIEHVVQLIINRRRKRRRSR